MYVFANVIIEHIIKMIIVFLIILWNLNVKEEYFNIFKHYCVWFVMLPICSHSFKSLLKLNYPDLEIGFYPKIKPVSKEMCREFFPHDDF